MLLALTLTLAAALQSAPAEDPAALLERASWIWAAPEVPLCHFRRTLKLDQAPARARIVITADNDYELFVNGARLGGDAGAAAEVWQSAETYDLSSRLVRGLNVIGVRGRNLGGAAGLVAAVKIEMAGRPALEILSDPAWKVSADPDPVEFAHPEFVEGADWTPARIVGPMGTAPWGRLPARAAARSGAAPARAFDAPGPDFKPPAAVAFIADDCSVYVPQRGDAWGVCFRAGDWSRAYTEFDLPTPSKIGRKLYSLRLDPPESGPRLLLDAGTGCLGSPSVSYDGRWIYLSMAAPGESFFHIYRLSAAGGAPERLTDGPFHDLDPAELPDGRIIFASTRIGTFEEYHAPPARALFVMEAGGRDIHPVTFTPIFDNEPKVMADGSVAFIRTDNFFDRAKVETQIHVMRPDGTGGLTALGAESGPDYGSRLRAFGYGSPAPLPDGRLAAISNRGSFVGLPGDPERRYARLPAGLGDLAPLADGRLLCTVLRHEGKQSVSDVLAVLDPANGRLTRLYALPTGSLHSPVALGARPRPPVLPSAVDRRKADRPDATGFLLCQNVRLTTKTKADWSAIRAVRVLAGVGLTTRSSHSHIVHAGHETVDLGLVPLASDGSFHVEVPADTPLALQAVDAEGRSELNEMSWIYVRPGEHRSCVGCHAPREASPSARPVQPLALGAAPLRLLGQGRPPRFRGNNAGVTGLMDLQFERFREIASINRHAGGPAATGLGERLALEADLAAADPASRISTLQHLAILRDRASAAAVRAKLQDPVREVRVAAALALASCGDRDSLAPLLDALGDEDPIAAQAAATALEALLGRAEPFEAFAPLTDRRRQAEAWRSRIAAPAVEESLIRDLAANDAALRRRAAVALGRGAGPAAAAALRAFVSAEGGKNPYPPFLKDDRTDRFTFPADSPLNPRTLQAAVRSLGQLRDLESIPLLGGFLERNLDPEKGNLFLAEACVEALGRIGTGACEDVLLGAAARLQEYWRYVGWYSDHPALYACHASPLHFRIFEALDALGSRRSGPLASRIIRSVPTDPDRALLLGNDDYEIIAGRLLRRGGREQEVIESCLALLGDAGAAGSKEIQEALSTVHAAWGGKPGPENRSAQILSLVCRDRAYEPRIRRAFERFLAKPEEAVVRTLGNPAWTPVRHWTLFYLARTLGALGDPASFEALAAVLAPELNEARHGRPSPDEPTVHFLQLDYTPCWRAAAADALGRIGDRRAVPVLLSAIRRLENATDVRCAAAAALGRAALPADLPLLREAAAGYPEVSTRRVLLRSCARLSGEAVVLNDR